MVKLGGEPSNLTGGGGYRRRRRGRTLGWPMYKPLGKRSERPWTPSDAVGRVVGSHHILQEKQTKCLKHPSKNEKVHLKTRAPAPCLLEAVAAALKPFVSLLVPLGEPSELPWTPSDAGGRVVGSHQVLQQKQAN